MNVFFDSSAWVKRYIEEAGSETVEEIISSAAGVAVSVLCLPESVSCFCRLRRERAITKNQYDVIRDSLSKDYEEVLICHLAPDVVHQAVAVLESRPLKALDALQVACALEVKPDLFVSGDDKQLGAARKAGLKVKRV